MDYAGPAARSPYGTRQGMLNVQDSAGNTALHDVAMGKRADIGLLYLRNKHVDVDVDLAIKNVEGMTAKESIVSPQYPRRSPTPACGSKVWS